MATSAGLFGVTYHGPTNGIAAVTLSIFNMDHARDRAWLQKVFNTVVPDGEMRVDHVHDLLCCFYHNRPEGSTLSGSYLTMYPPAEKECLESLFEDASSTISFETLLQFLQEAQGARTCSVSELSWVRLC